MVVPLLDSCVRATLNQQKPDECDYSQDTDDGSIEIQPAQKKKAKQDTYTEILDYFHAPVWKTGNPPNTALNYKCKWCHNTYRGQKSLRGNLKTHRDGSLQSDKNPHGCPNCEKAKKAGVILPLSVAKNLALKETAKGNGTQAGIAGFLQFKPIFNNRVLNQILMAWQIRQALPWTRIEDPYLCAAFQFSNPKAFLYGRQWSANEAIKLYKMLKKTVFEELSGNRFAFIGAAIAYVNRDWEYVVQHLALKMIPWKH
ncbi:hypothetical protein PCANC_07895 [Puccinia coronata f. sp. avenae]|uniref:Uncharacterized protein n=1 Tax=Puccinia coronata f. sp. avenae TaxID=200324 RepID=A0A2N5VCY3_9BASI|nr:hypothetical protein PCANC_07895 [Puccinia coronata f. sp. avenae]